jgi:hypothetical protein
MSSSVKLQESKRGIINRSGLSGGPFGFCKLELLNKSSKGTREDADAFGTEGHPPAVISAALVYGWNLKRVPAHT